MQEMVRTHQEELLRLAWLLTGSRQGTTALVRRVFLQLFGSAAEADSRDALLGQLACCYLSGTLTIGDDLELACLTREERLTLVYGSLAGVPLAELNQMVSSTGVPLSTEAGDLEQRTGIGVQEVLVAGMEYPRVDLWPAISAEMEEERRYRRKRRLTTAGTFAMCCFAVVLIGLAASYRNGASLEDLTQTVIPTPRMASVDEVLAANHYEPPTPTPFVPAASPGSVPAGVLSQETIWHDGAPTENVLSFLPLVDTDAQGDAAKFAGSVWTGPLLSPDGSLIVTTLSQREETQITFQVVALESATLTERWRNLVGPFPIDPETGRSTTRTTVTLSLDRAYVARWDDEFSEEIALLSFDLESGKPQESTVLPAERSANEWLDVRMHLAPDGSRLFVTQIVRSQFGGQNYPEISTHAFRLPQLTFGETIPHPDEARETSWRGLTVEPGRYILHGVRGVSQEQMEPGYQFLDLESGTLTEIPISVYRYRQGNPYYMLTIPDNSGRRVYLIGQETGQVAVINLIEQRLEYQFTIDTGRYFGQFGTGAGQYAFGSHHVLSFDGTTLYIRAVGPDLMRHGDTEYSTGIWKIDLHSWTIVDFLQLPGDVREMIGTSDGADLIVSTWFYEQPGISPAELRTLRVATGDGLEVVDRIDRPSATQLTSLASLYRSQYGQSPVVNSVMPEDVENFTTMPAYESTLGGSPASGVPSSIVVRVLHPMTGEPMQATGGGIRFDFRSQIIARVRAESGTSRLVALSGIEPGVYRGGLILPEDGRWTVDLIIDSPTGQRTIALHTGEISIGPTFAGSDGNSYLLRLSTVPETLVVDEEAVIRLRMVNADTGQRLPAGVDFNVDQPVLNGAPIDELPDEMRVTVNYLQGNKVVTLTQISRSTWEGVATFSAAEIVGTVINIQVRGAARITTPGPDLRIVSGEP